MKSKKDLELIEEFMVALRIYINYWIMQKDGLDERERMEGLIHSVLVTLDGMSNSFKGDIKKIEKASRGLMLHEIFYERDE